ncbi:MAG: hypothetical protein ACJ8CB_24800 [Ktedonobacteraceae bacterium]
MEGQLQRLTDAYLAKVLELDEYKRRRQEVEQRLQALAGQVRQLEASVECHHEVAGLVNSIQAFCQRVQQGLAEATFEQKWQLVELLIDRVVVTEEEVGIRYVIPTSSRSEHICFCHLHLDYFDCPALPIQGKDAHRLLFVLDRPVRKPQLRLPVRAEHLHLHQPERLGHKLSCSLSAHGRGVGQAQRASR